MPIRRNPGSCGSGGGKMLLLLPRVPGTVRETYSGWIYPFETGKCHASLISFSFYSFKFSSYRYECCAKKWYTYYSLFSITSRAFCAASNGT
jgi:hypothetical protein